MEALKRHLIEGLPIRIHGAHGLRRGSLVLVCGLPAPRDLDGQLRLEGVATLLAALGLRMVLAPAGASPRPIPAPIALGPIEAGIWLGAAPLRTSETARLAPGATMLRWSTEEGPAAVAADGGTLPDPIHALWGLLDHHPPGAGILDLRTGPGVGDGWTGLLTPGHVALLEHAGRLHRATGVAGPLHRVRARLVEAMRQVVAGGAAVRTDRLAPSLLAALLGRHVLDQGGKVSAYWQRWDLLRPQGGRSRSGPRRAPGAAAPSVVFHA